MDYFIFAIIMLVAGAIFSLLTKENLKLKISTLFSFIAFITALYPAITVLVTGQTQFNEIKNFSLFGPILFSIDALSAFFIIIISIMGFCGLFYANGYLKDSIGNGKPIASHCFFLMILFASMLAITGIQNGLAFLIFWEIMSLSSFFLVAFDAEKPEVIKSAIKYLIYMHFSVIFLIAMFAMLTNATSSFSFANYGQILSTNSHLASVVFVLGFIGFGIKAGFVPFHNWLPDAHPAAPTHVSGIMSGIMIKTGIYGILRILFLIGSPTKMMGYLVLIIAIITSLYGVLYAATQKDIKRLLAYSSIENIGIIGVGLAIGILGMVYNNNVMSICGFSGALLHILNHSIFKELLFFSIGNIYKKTHTRNIEMLGGLIHKMPYTSIMLIIGAAAICGLPVLNGFVSEILIYGGMLLGIPAPNITLFLSFIVSIATLALVGTIAILTFTKLAGISLLGNPRSENSALVKEDSSWISTGPLAVLSIFIFAIGIFPQYIFQLVVPPLSLLLKFDNFLPLVSQIAILLKQLSNFILIFLAILAICVFVKSLLNRHTSTHSTWGCGYDKPNNSIQYTASSYVNPFVTMLKPLFKRVSHIKKPKDLFPKEAYYEQEFQDIEEAYIVNPIIKWDEKFLTKFERIQNGNIQQYILFGLVFLILSIIGLIFLG